SSEKWLYEQLLLCACRSGPSSTAPTWPPPVENTLSPQQLFVVEPSSNVMRMSPWFWYAYDAWMIGTTLARNAFALTRPPVPGLAPSAPGPLHPWSWPSSQRFGVMNVYAGAYVALATSVAKRENFSTLVAQLEGLPAISGSM